MSYSITVEDHTNAATGACAVTVFLTVPDVPGAVSYVVDVGGTHLTGPPFSEVIGDLAGNTLKSPPGKHRWALTGQGQSSGSCAKAKSEFEAQVKSFWKVTRAEVTIGGSSLSIGGTVRDDDGKGIKGVVVTASGPSSVKGTTDTSGAFSLKVRKGAYKVSAGAKYCVVGLSGCETSTSVSVPPSRAVNFKLPAGGPDAIDWLMPARFTKASLAGRDENGLPAARDVTPSRWTATLFTRKKSAQFDCGSDVRFVWTVKEANRLVDGKQPRVACRSKLEVTELGTYSVSAQLQRRTGGAWRDEGKAINGKVDVRDWLVVGMGDSNGSGEGNPPFYYKRCNRSIASYQAQVALDLELKDPHSSVTFIHTSCSGARVEHLVDADYAGTRGGSPPLQPQIGEVSALLEQHGVAPKRTVDVALISAGVNDLAFGPTLEFCVKIGLTTLLDPACQLRKVTAAPEPGSKRIGSYRADPRGTTLAAHLKGLQGLLAGRFEDLAAALPRLGVRRDHVFLAQYPDFTHGSDGQFCGTTGLARFLPSTWEWLSANAALLNEHVKQAAAVAGRSWVVPDYDLTAFMKRGYCSSDSLFRDILGAHDPYPVGRDYGGPFHPNGEGHEIEAAGTLPAVCRKLYKGDATCNAPKKTP